MHANDAQPFNRGVHKRLGVIGVRFSWHYLNVFRVQNPPFALGLSKGSGGLRQAQPER